MTYDGRPHLRLATLPGMFERTLTVSSAGKTFSVTVRCTPRREPAAGPANT